MKKIFIFLLGGIVLVISIFYAKYMVYKQEQSEIKKENLEYEQYVGKQVDGRDLTSIINRAVNNNERLSVSKNEQGYYIKDDVNSINIDIKIIDNDTTYKMETIYNGGMASFVQYYNSVYFDCKDVEYNSLGKLNYMLFEQQTI